MTQNYSVNDCERVQRTFSQNRRSDVYLFSWHCGKVYNTIWTSVSVDMYFCGPVVKWPRSIYRPQRKSVIVYDRS